jgi:phage gp36-like protein
MSYASPSDFLKRYDARVLGDLVGDSGVRVDPSALLQNVNVQAALDDASGMIDSAVLVAQKYTPDELAALTGVDAAFLIRIVCNLAFGLLTMRRGQPTEQIEQYKEALAALELLRSGERVFNVLANEEAGNPSASFPSFSVYSNLQLMRDVAKVFPVRRDQRVS